MAPRGRPLKRRIVFGWRFSGPWHRELGTASASMADPSEGLLPAAKGIGPHAGASEPQAKLIVRGRLADGIWKAPALRAACQPRPGSQNCLGEVPS